MENKECAHREKNRCKILNIKRCPSHICRFCQTGAQITMSRNDSDARLAQLDMEEQNCIAEKYYGGKRVWMKGGSSHGN